MDRRGFLRGILAGTVTALGLGPRENGQNPENHVDKTEKTSEKTPENMGENSHATKQIEKIEVTKEYNVLEIMEMLRKEGDIFVDEISRCRASELHIRPYEGMKDDHAVIAEEKKYDGDIPALLKKEYARIFEEEWGHVEQLRFSDKKTGEICESCKVDYIKFYKKYEKEILNTIVRERDIFEQEQGVHIPLKVLLGILMIENPRSLEIVSFDEQEGPLTYESSDRDKPAGPFQLNKKTAEHFGLMVSEEHDERFSFPRALRAAMKKLKEGYERFGNQWGFAMVNYSSSMGSLIARIETSFGEDVFHKEQRGKVMSEGAADERGVNIVTYHRFAGWGKKVSAQYPFQAFALVDNLLVEKKFSK